MILTKIKARNHRMTLFSNLKKRKASRSTKNQRKKKKKKTRKTSKKIKINRKDFQPTRKIK
jgi:hypothetical protein